MAYVNQNDSLVLAAGEDSESGFDLIHAEFIQQIRISGLGSSTDNDSTAAEADKTLATDRDKDCSDQVAADALQKTLKLRRDSDVSNAVTSSDESKLFDAGGGSIGAGSGGGGGVTPSLQHCFSGVGSSSSGSTAGSFVFGCISSSSLDKNDESAVAAGSRGRSVSKHSTIGKVYRKIKEPPLNVSFPSKIGSYELKVLKQPEEQHRARYLTEGSRGTVKDQSGQGHPTIKLCGYDQPVALQVFVGTDVGRMKPHGFYQACKVSNKNSTACIERDIEGTTVIEITFDPKQEMVAV